MWHTKVREVLWYIRPKGVWQLKLPILLRRSFCPAVGKLQTAQGSLLFISII